MFSDYVALFSALKFQENLLLTMLQLEQVFFDLAESSKRNCLIICDRGTMDASAFISAQVSWGNSVHVNLSEFCTGELW